MNVRILHVSHDDITGGAARCAYRLHRGLRRLDQDSRMLVARRRSNDPTVAAFSEADDLVSKIRRGYRRAVIARDHERFRRNRPEGFEQFSDDRSAYDVCRTLRLPICDVLNLHWVSGFLDHRRAFRWIPDHIPVVWTLHDMNLFTGGCHYDHGCGRYKETCGACPQLGSTDEHDLSHQIWRRKRELLSGLEPGRLHIVTPSRWLANRVKRSSALDEKFPIHVIPYGLNTDDFAPRDRRLARGVLGIPQDVKVVLFVAHALDIRRKGFSLLVDALKGLEEREDLFLLSVGKRSPSLGAGIAHRHVSFTVEDRLLSLIYSAADVFVLPTLQDNLPATVLEAMACGTPVVAFRVGGLPEMVRSGITGELATPEDVEALRAAVINLLSDPGKRAQMSLNCRRIVLEEYNLELQAQRYLQLYRELGSDRAVQPPIPTAAGKGEATVGV